MKKYISAALVVSSFSVIAAPTVIALTTGTAATLTNGTAGVYQITGDGANVGDKFFTATASQAGSFVKVVFTVTAGNNVATAVRNDSDKFSVASASTKGNQVFGGNSTVGAVRLLNGCPADTCAASDATTGGIATAYGLSS